MTLQELRDLAGLILSFNANQVDGDFTPAMIDAAINRAYEREWNLIVSTADLVVTELTYDTTWTGGAYYLDIPSALTGYRLNDLVVVEADHTETQLVVESDGTRLFWRPDGPDATLNIRFKYAAMAEALTSVAQTPQRIPKAHHQFLAWSAAIELKEIADQAVPNNWYTRLENMRLDALKATELLFANQRHQYTRQKDELLSTVNFDAQ